MEGASIENFGFAFNNIEFSDRVLHIEIIREQVPPKNDSDCSLPNKLKETLLLNPLPSSNDSDVCLHGVQIKRLHCSSLILAAKSPYFYKLFKIGVKDSQQKDVILRINSSEEAALMDLLKFMYTNTLSATTKSDLVDVLMAANKFEVTSCVKHCILLLEEKPISLESALIYLKLPSTVLAFQSLIDASKQYLVAHFRDFEKSKQEAVELPLCALEVVLGSDGLRVDSEDVVYEFILDWGYKHFPNLEKRREILTNRLLRFIYFQYMSCYKFREVLSCAEFHHEQVSKLVMEALFVKHEVPYGQHICGARRLYNRRLVKIVHLEFPAPRAVIYFNLKKEECRSLSSLDKIVSESFLVGGRWFGFEAQKIASLYFGLYLFTVQGSETCTVDFDFAVMKKASSRYEIQQNTGSRNATVRRTGRSLFTISWADFMRDESEYFINGILHLQADITIISS